jgi:hypothetical protein
VPPHFREAVRVATDNVRVPPSFATVVNSLESAETEHDSHRRPHFRKLQIAALGVHMDDVPRIARIERADRRWAIAWRVIRWTAAVVVLLALAFVSVPKFSSSCVCDQCGCEGNDVEFQVPFTRLTFWRLHSEERTPLTDLADELGFVPSHSHHWEFCAGGGDGSCALGRGRESAHLARSEKFIEFVRCAERYRGRAEAHAWTEAALDSNRAKAVREWVFMWSVSKDRIHSTAEYDEWWKTRDRIWAEVQPELVRTRVLRLP